MKKFLIASGLPLLLALVGCGGSRPYQVIDIQRGPAQTTVFVEAPVGASQSDMETWAKEVERAKGDGKSAVMVNFYNGGRGAQNMIGSYQGGTLFKTR